MDQFFKSQWGGQFFKVEGPFVKLISIYDFNPAIERRKLSPGLLDQLRCTPCSKEEFEAAQQKAITLLDLPEPALIPA